LGFAPMLPVSVSLGEEKSLTLLGTYFSKQLAFGKQDFTTGVRVTHPWWRVQGSWPDDNSEDILLGAHLAARLNRKAGQEIEIGGQPHRISGILSTGGAEEDQIVAPLPFAQQILGRPGAVRRIYVSAVTKPEDAFARRDPKSMSPKTYERWYCSPYAQSIAFQLREAVPHSHAEQIRQVAQNEGTVLSRIKGLMLLITLAALMASALAVSASMATAVFERRSEVGLMKALGAGNLAVAVLFFAESALLALVAGSAGFAGGALLARQIGQSIFDSQITIQPVLLPVILSIAVIVTFGGSAAAIRRAVKFDPVYALRGDA
jgi:putative ABC transport system permease protein